MFTVVLVQQPEHNQKYLYAAHICPVQINQALYTPSEKKIKKGHHQTCLLTEKLVSLANVLDAKHVPVVSELDQLAGYDEPLVLLPMLEVTLLLAAVSNSLSAIGTHSGTRMGGQILPRRAPTCRSRNSINFSTKAPVGLKSASMLLCPAPSTQNGFALQGCGNAMNKSSPCQKGTTSSCVP